MEPQQRAEHHQADHNEGRPEHGTTDWIRVQVHAALSYVLRLAGHCAHENHVRPNRARHCCHLGWKLRSFFVFTGQVSCLAVSCPFSRVKAGFLEARSLLLVWVP